ncbi:MAG: DUF2017 family protein, partial [Microthrixaceae bacterium]|nr:DUF2017 family protein [Microthrixaceae bacterium]
MAFGLRGAVVRPRPDGAYDVRMRHGERDLLGHLLGQLRELLTAGSGGGAAGADVDPVLRRLFPTAYPDDAELDAEYQGLVRDDLLEGRLAAIDVVEETVDADVITEEQLLAWMGAVNDLRLVIGT